MKILSPRKWLALTGVLLPLGFASPQAWATACVDGDTFASYEATNATGGCTIGDKTFSNFTYTSSATNATKIDAGGVTVDTIGPAGSGATLSGPDIGLQFNAGWTVGSGQILDSLIGFDVAVTDGPALIKDAGLVQGGSGISGNGIGSVAENACAPAPCTPSGAINLLTVDTAGEVSLTDMAIFTPTGSLSVTKDISVNGNSGTAEISRVNDTFSQTSVPEPASLTLLGSTLVAFGWVGHRRRKPA
jgi:hypothetical protein